MKTISHIPHILALIFCLTLVTTAEAQTPDKATPAIKRGKVIFQTGQSANAMQQASTANSKPAKVADKRDKATGSKEKKSSAKEPKAATPSNRYIALKTNLPFLALAVQNLALEVQCGKHISIDLPVMWSISDLDPRHALRTFAMQPEARWWMGNVGKGHFFGLHAHVAWFNLKWKDDRYQTAKRPLLGAGLSYGYQLPLGTHWAAEFNIGAGYANMKYNTYYNIANGAQIDTRIRDYWGITRAGLSLVYRF